MTGSTEVVLKRYEHKKAYAPKNPEEQRLEMELKATGYHLSDLSWFSLRLRPLRAGYTQQILITFLKPMEFKEVKKRVHEAFGDLNGDS